MFTNIFLIVASSRILASVVMSLFKYENFPSFNYLLNNCCWCSWLAFIAYFQVIYLLVKRKKKKKIIIFTEEKLSGFHAGADSVTKLVFNLIWTSLTYDKK